MRSIASKYGREGEGEREREREIGERLSQSTNDYFSRSVLNDFLSSLSSTLPLVHFIAGETHSHVCNN